MFTVNLLNSLQISPPRSDPDFVCRVLGEVIKAGATTLNIPDTVGYTIPKEFGELIAYLRKNTEGAENVIFSTHCQNDLGLATGNTLAVSICVFAYLIEDEMEA